MANVRLALGTPKVLRLDVVDRDPDQPRQVFPEEDAEDLKDSIKKNGIHNPNIYVRPNPTKEGRYLIVAGERRSRALRALGVEEFEFRVVGKGESPYIISLIENQHRLELNPMDEAEAYQKAMKKEGLSVVELAEKIEKKPADIYRTQRLLKLPPVVKELIRAGKLKTGKAYNLVQFQTQGIAKQIELAQQLIAGEDPPELDEQMTETSAQSEAVIVGKLPKDPEGIIRRLLQFRQRSNPVPFLIKAFLDLPEEKQAEGWQCFTKTTRLRFLSQMRTLITSLQALEQRIAALSGEDGTVEVRPGADPGIRAFVWGEEKQFVDEVLGSKTAETPSAEKEPAAAAEKETLGASEPKETAATVEAKRNTDAKIPGVFVWAKKNGSWGLTSKPRLGTTASSTEKEPVAVEVKIPVFCGTEQRQAKPESARKAAAPPPDTPRAVQADTKPVQQKPATPVVSIQRQPSMPEISDKKPGKTPPSPTQLETAKRVLVFVCSQMSEGGREFLSKKSLANAIGNGSSPEYVETSAKNALNLIRQYWRAPADPTHPEIQRFIALLSQKRHDLERMGCAKFEDLVRVVKGRDNSPDPIKLG